MILNLVPYQYSLKHLRRCLEVVRCFIVWLTVSVLSYIKSESEIKRVSKTLAQDALQGKSPATLFHP